MITKFQRLFLSFIFIINVATVWADELIMVEAVSSSQKSFAIAKGARDQIALGQKSLFSSKNFSIVAQAVEVGQINSMWQIVAKDNVVPFKKGEFINYSRHPHEVWSKIAELKGIYEKRAEEKKREVVLDPYSIQILAGYTHSISENVNISELDSNSNRQGFAGTIFLNYALTPRLEVGLGFRMDKDSYMEDNPSVELDSTRYFVMGDFTYHFPKFKKSLGNIFTGISVGYGPSESTIDNQNISGNSLLLPSLRLGYLHPLAQKLKLVVEANLEAITAKEDFATGETQKTTIVSGRVNIGFRY